MRPTRQVKVVTSQLEGFVSIKKQLEMLLEDIKNIIKKGEYWLLGNDEGETFPQIIQSLDLEMESCLKNIYNIAAGDHNVQTDELNETNENSLTPMSCAEVNNKTLFTKFEEHSNSLDILSKKLKSLQEKFKIQSNTVETISKNSTAHDFEYNIRFDEIMTELHTASDFIQSQTEVFYEKVKQCEVKCEAEVDEGFENINEKLNKHVEIFTKRLEEYEKLNSSNFNEIKMQIQTLTQKLSNLEKENEFSLTKIKEKEQTLTDIPKGIDSHSTESKYMQLVVFKHDSTLHRNYTNVSERYGSPICTDKSDITVEDYGQVVLFEDASTEYYLYGNHEIQVSEGGEPDLYKHFTGCKKNPGHMEFIPVDMFNVNHLPEGYRDQDLCEFIKSTSDITVRVDVKMTSPHRPEFWPNTNVSFPFYNMRGKDILRTGSGIICWVYEYTNEKELLSRKKCWCKKCEHSDTASNVWWEFEVYTAMIVVFDSSEASHTSLKLFYNSEKSPVISIDKVDFIDKKHDRDSRRLKCVTCDKNVGEKLHSSFKYHLNNNHKIFKKFRESRDVEKFNFIVSHPHGYCKHVSFGHWVDKYKIDNHKYKLTYTTCTCPGSSGALVYCLGYGVSYIELLHNGNLNSKINFSGAAMFN